MCFKALLQPLLLLLQTHATLATQNVLAESLMRFQRFLADIECTHHLKRALMCVVHKITLLKE